MNEDMSDLPQAENADPDGVQVALRAAQTLWSRGDTTESLRWLRKAAESASDEGADLRSLQLAKAAAELRAKLFGTSEPPRSPAPATAPGESGAHPIAQLRNDSESPHAPLSSRPPASSSGDAFSSGMVSDAEGSGLGSSRPVTATQYPSHRPRQRIGLSSPGTMSSMAMSSAQRDGAAYAAVPSWSADSERRVSNAPPPLPRAALAEYEELDAEPDEESLGDDPASVWSSAGPESWQSAESGAHAFASSFQGSSTPSPPAATPPPLPPRGAFADDSDFSEASDLPTVVIPSAEENADERARESHRVDNSFSVQGQDLGGDTLQSSAWDQQSRTVGWEQETGLSWANEAQAATWGGGANIEPQNPEPAPQSETARAKLTARVHHQAVRVSFAPDQRVPGQYVVRPLREGEKAGTGERIALLVGLEPGVPLV
jgi:hypothetical protein